MFEGGPSNPKGISFIVQLGAYAYFALGPLGYGLLGDLEEGFRL